MVPKSNANALILRFFKKEMCPTRGWKIILVMSHYMLHYLAGGTCSIDKQYISHRKVLFTVHFADYLANSFFIIKDHRFVKCAKDGCLAQTLCCACSKATNQKPERRHTHLKKLLHNINFLSWRFNKLYKLRYEVSVKTTRNKDMDGTDSLRLDSWL